MDIVYILLGLYIIFFLGFSFLQKSFLLTSICILLGTGILWKNIFVRYICAIVVILLIGYYSLAISTVTKVVADLQERVTAMDVTQDALDETQILIPYVVFGQEILLSEIPLEETRIKAVYNGYLISLERAERIIKNTPKQKNKFYLIIFFQSVILIILVLPEVRKLFGYKAVKDSSPPLRSGSE